MLNDLKTQRIALSLEVDRSRRWRKSTALDKIRQEIAENQIRVEAASEYLRLTDLRYRGGVVSYLEVLDAQRQMFAAELDLSSAKLTQLLAAIDLYRALGGGWSDEELLKLSERPMTATQ